MTLDVQALLERAGIAGLQRIALADIVPNPDNPRRDIDPEDVTALAASIVERGLLQPISVFPANQAGLYVIRFGERRYRAALQAGLTDIMAIIADPAEMVDLLIDQVIENDQRVDLSTIEMAEAIAALSRFGLSKADIARRLARPPATISLYAAVPEMPAALQALACSVTIRPLHDLYRLWRDAPEAVEAFVDQTPADAIDRRSVAAFGARLKESADAPLQQAAPASTDAPGPQVRQPVEKPMVENTKVPTSGSVRVAVDGENGVLLFPPGLSDGLVMVRVDGSRAPVVVPAGSVRILATC